MILGDSNKVVGKLVAQGLDECVYMHFKRLQQLCSEIEIILKSCPKEMIEYTKLNAIVEITQLLMFWTHLNLCAPTPRAIDTIWSNNGQKEKVLNSVSNVTINFGNILYGSDLHVFSTKYFLKSPINLN